MFSPRILIIGVGNPLLTDDGIGHWVIDNLAGRFPDGYSLRKEVDLDLSDVEDMREFTLIFIIDAYDHGGELASVVITRPGEHQPAAPNMISAHGQHLYDILGLGNRIYPDFPKHIYVIGIQVKDTFTWHEGFSAEIEPLLPVIRERVFETIESVTGGKPGP